MSAIKVKSKSKSFHSSIKCQCPPSPELDKKITSKYGFQQVLTSSNYELFFIEVKKYEHSTLAINLTDSCVVHTVNREDCDVIFGDLWLELNGVWLEDKKHFTDLYRQMKKETNCSVLLKLKIARLIWKQKLPDNRMPMDILPLKDYTYHLAVIYGIPGMHLTLALKALNGKVFVSSVSEETLGRMAFAVGDAILEVENVIVSNIQGAYEQMKQALKARGIVTCVVERAGSSNASFYVREAIRSDKNPMKEERLNKDVEKICRREKRRIERETAPPQTKSILREPGKKQNKRVTLKPTHDIVHINADINPQLLQPVPSHNVVPSDTLLAPGRSAESILSELSSEPTDEEGHQDAKASKSRPQRQKDCRSTTGTKVMKRAAEKENARKPSSQQPQDASPKGTKESDSAGKGKPPPPTSSKTQHSNDSAGKRTMVKTVKTQNTDSGRKTTTTQSKTPQDTDSRKKTHSSKTPDTESRKRRATPSRLKSKGTSTNSPKTSPKNSLRGNSNSQR